MEGQTLKYPQLSATAVGFSNRLNHGDANKLEFTIGGQAYALHPVADIKSCSFPITVHCSINGSSMRLGIDASCCNLLLSDWLLLEELAGLPDDLRKSIVIAAFNPISNFFTEHAIGNFHAEDIECQPIQSSDSSLFFHLLSANGAITGQAFADADEQTINTLHKVWQAAAVPVSGINTEDLCAAVEVIAAEVTLSIEEFSQVEKGDIILLDKAFSDLTKVYAKISDNISFSSVIDGNKLIIQKRSGVMASDEQPTEDLETKNPKIPEQEVEDHDE